MQHESATAAVATAGIHYVGPNGKDTMDVMSGQPLAASSVPQSHALLLSNIPRYQPQPRASLSPHAIWSLPQSIHDARRATDELPQEVITSCGGNPSLSEIPEATAAFTSTRDVNNPTYPSLAAERPKINDPEAIQKAAFRFQQHQLHKGAHQQPSNQNLSFIPTSTAPPNQEVCLRSGITPNFAPPSISKRSFEAIGSVGLSSQGQQRNVRHRFFSNVSSREQPEQAVRAVENPHFSDSRVEEGSRNNQNSVILQQSQEQHLEQFIQAPERGRHDELNELLQDQNQERKLTSAQRLQIEHFPVQHRNELSHTHAQYHQKIEQKRLPVYQRPHDNQYQPIHSQERKQHSNWNQPERYQSEYSQQRRQQSKHQHHDIYLKNQSCHVQPINETLNQPPSIQMQGNVLPQQRLNQSLQMSSSQQQHGTQRVNSAPVFNQVEQHYRRDSHTDNRTHPMSHHTTMQSHPSTLQESQIQYNMGRFDELRPIVQSNLLAATALHPNLRSNQPRIIQGTISEEDGKTSEGARTVLDIRGTHSDSRDVDDRSADVEDVPDLLHTSEANETMPYTCAQCAARFKDREQRKLHIQMVHAKPYMCHVCKSSFTRKFDLEKHSLTVHERVRPYACDQCHNSFGQKHHLVRHKKAIHIKARDFACDICEAKFARKEHLANHKRAVHDKSKPFLCSLCDVQYCEKRALRRHLEHVHSVKSSRSAALAAWQPSSKSPPPSIGEILQL